MTRIQARPLRGLERFMNQLHPSMGPQMNVLELEGPLTLALLRKAGEKLQRRHAVLRSKILDKSQLVLLPPDEKSLEVREAPQGSDWRKVLELESQRPFDPEAGYFLRLVLIAGPAGTSRHHVLVALNHTLGDGQSMYLLANGLMKELAALEKGDSARTGHTAAAGEIGLPPPALELLPQGFFVRWLVSRFGGRIVLRTIGAFQRKLLASTLPSDSRHPTHFAFRSASARECGSLHQRCKAEGVTLGAAFGAAVQLALLRHLRRHHPAFVEGSSPRIPMSVNLDLRSRAPGGEKVREEVGLYIAAAEISPKLAHGASLWSLARKLGSEIRRGASLRNQTLFQLLADGSEDFHGDLERAGLPLERSRGATSIVNFSNVGRFPFPTEQGSYRLHSIQGANAIAWGGPMFIFWLRGVGGRLHFSFAAASRITSREAADALLEDAIRTLFDQSPPMLE